MSEDPQLDLHPAAGHMPFQLCMVILIPSQLLFYKANARLKFFCFVDYRWC